MGSAKDRKRAFSVGMLAELDGLEVVHARLQSGHFPIHFHDTFVVEWVTSGVDRCELSQREARRGQLFVHGPRVPHCGGAGSIEALEYRACYPSLDLVASLLDVTSLGLPSIGFLVLDGRAVQAAATRLFVSLEDGDDVRHVRTHLRRLFELIFDAAPQNATHVAERIAGTVERLDHAAAHLRRHAARHVSTAELAEVCGWSPSHTIREFKRVYGMAPRQFAINTRVARARGEIRAGKSVLDAAHDWGFSDQSHFTRQFKQVAGYGPGQLRAARQQAGRDVPLD